LQYYFLIVGIPEGVDPCIVEMMLPTIKGDYAAFESYILDPIAPPVPIHCNLTIFIAENDASFDKGFMANWKFCTTSEYYYRSVIVPGAGHSYVTDPSTRELFHAMLREECEREDHDCDDSAGAAAPALA
jgi:surfactin synthase thioesterase subunit